MSERKFSFEPRNLNNNSGYQVTRLKRKFKPPKASGGFLGAFHWFFRGLLAMQVRLLPTVGVAAAAAALAAAAAYLYSGRTGWKGYGGFRNGTVPARVGVSGKGKKEEVKEEAPRPKVDVYFGSQTGTAEDFGKQVQREGIDRGLDVTVIDLEHYDKAHVSSATAVFLVATYGEGEPTDNGRDFHDWLVSEENEAALSDLTFAVFALGNTQYEHFNSFGKAVPALSLRHVEPSMSCLFFVGRTSLVSPRSFPLQSQQICTTNSGCRLDTRRSTRVRQSWLSLLLARGAICDSRACSIFFFCHSGRAPKREGSCTR